MIWNPRFDGSVGSGTTYCATACGFNGTVFEFIGAAQIFFPIFFGDEMVTDEKECAPVGRGFNRREGGIFSFFLILFKMLTFIDPGYSAIQDITLFPPGLLGSIITRFYCNGRMAKWIVYG